MNEVANAANAAKVEAKAEAMIKVEQDAGRVDARESEAPAGAGIRCDFCKTRVPSVRRIALDQDYERLRTAHSERYACPACSERKERERLGRPRA
jgi:hypothetical protein